MAIPARCGQHPRPAEVGRAVPPTAAMPLFLNRRYSSGLLNFAAHSP